MDSQMKARGVQNPTDPTNPTEPDPTLHQKTRTRLTRNPKTWNRNFYTKCRLGLGSHFPTRPRPETRIYFFYLFFIYIYYIFIYTNTIIPTLFPKSLIRFRSTNEWTTITLRLVYWKSRNGNNLKWEQFGTKNIVGKTPSFWNQKMGSWEQFECIYFCLNLYTMLIKK